MPPPHAGHRGPRAWLHSLRGTGDCNLQSRQTPLAPNPLRRRVVGCLNRGLLGFCPLLGLLIAVSPYESSSSFNAVSRKRTLAYKPEFQSLCVGVSHYGMTRSRLLGSALLLPSSLPSQSPDSPIHLPCSIIQRQPPYQRTHGTNMITGSIGVRRASCSTHIQAKTLSSIIGNTHSHAGYLLSIRCLCPGTTSCTLSIVIVLFVEQLLWLESTQAYVLIS